MAVMLKIALVTAAICGAFGVQANDMRADLAYLAVSEGYWEIWVARSDGSRARQVTHWKSDSTRVSWYPDGEALLANRSDGKVVKVDLSGERESLIPLDQYPIVDAALSPDGKRIAYSFSTAIDGNDIWIAGSDGAGAEKIVRMATLQHEPVWSPDGKYLYFLSGGGGQAHDIWRILLDGSSAEQLTVNQLYHFDVAVSSNGDLAFSSNRSGNYEIYLQRVGGAPEQLTNHAALDGRPAFSPDGKYLVFESTRDRGPNLWRMDLASRSTTQITRHRAGARGPTWYQGERR